MQLKIVPRAGLCLAALALAWAAVPRPPLRQGLGFSQQVLDRKGRLLRLTLSPDEKYRLWLPLEAFSRELVAATLAKEDRWFRFHPGFNPVALARAAWTTYVRRTRTVGGSTLTMQLARVRYGLKTRTIGGKLAQILRAAQLELRYSKDEILEAYLNVAPYGGNIEGAGAASLVYFGKPAGAISAQEARLLSELPQDPGPRGARLAGRADVAGRDALPFEAPHFADRALAEDHGRSQELRTTLDLDLQRALEAQVRDYVRERGAEGIGNAAVLLLEHRTAAIRAAVGSADFFDARIQGQVDGTRAPRSPGSTLKPFVYALGIDQGLIHAESVLEDAPSTFGAFAPENFDGKFEGPVSARDALIRSRNVPAVAVAARLAEPDFFDFLRRAGVDLPRGRDHYGLAPVLGGAEISMERLAALYAMLASRGLFREPRAREDEPAAEPRRLASPEAAYIVLDILAGNPRPAQGFRPEWTRDAPVVAWKTGTSYGFRDAWAAGILGQYVLVVWAGNFDGRGDPALVGAKAAAPLFFRIADALRPELEDPGLLAHERLGGLREARVCAASGKTPGPACPHVKSAWVVPGVSPIEACRVHRAVLVDRDTGLRDCRDSPRAVAKVYEFWPSNLLEIYRKAGIPRRLPPPPAPGCGAVFAQAGRPPRITSPDGASAYALRLAKGEGQTVPLSAVADADAAELFWFADERFLGKVRPGEPLFWIPRAGRSVLRVVDEHGRSDARPVAVTWVR